MQSEVRIQLYEQFRGARSISCEVILVKEQQ